MISAHILRTYSLPALLVVALLAGCVGPRKVSDRDIKTIDLSTLMALVERQAQEPGRARLLLIDSRARSSYDTARIPGAVSMLLSDIDPEMGRDPRIEAYDEIVVYGDNPGTASSKALTKRLMRLRYKNVRLFAGGLDAWRRAGLAVEPAGAP